MVLVVAIGLGSVAGCSSGGSTTTTATTLAPAPGDPASTVVTLCDAYRRLSDLSQATSGTDPSNLSNVAENIVVLRTLADELTKHPPPSVATPVRHYAAVIRYVADTLAQQPTTGDSSLRQLSNADSNVISAYVQAHCTGTSPSTTA